MSVEAKFIIHSLSEYKITGGAGYWSNADGWVERQHAEEFSTEDTQVMELPISDGLDAKWVEVKKPSTANLRLIVEVAYELNEESLDTLKTNLHNVVRRAVGEGLLSANTDATVETWSAHVVEVSEPPTEEEVADLMLGRLETGGLKLEDVPLYLARYGLMHHDAFAEEMRERIESQST